MRLNALCKLRSPKCIMSLNLSDFGYWFRGHWCDPLNGGGSLGIHGPVDHPVIMMCFSVHMLLDIDLAHRCFWPICAMCTINTYYVIRTVQNCKSLFDILNLKLKILACSIKSDLRFDMCSLDLVLKTNFDIGREFDVDNLIIMSWASCW